MIRFVVLHLSSCFKKAKKPFYLNRRSEKLMVWGSAPRNVKMLNVVRLMFQNSSLSGASFDALPLTVHK